MWSWASLCWLITLSLYRYLPIYWKTVKLCRIFPCTEILFQWISFSKYATFSCFGGLLLTPFFFQQYLFAYFWSFAADTNTDGRIPRVWSKEEEEVWQTDRLKCNDQFQRPWWGCWSLRVRIYKLCIAIHHSLSRAK